MPRHLPRVLRILEKWPVQQFSPEEGRLRDYFTGSWGWYALGIELSHRSCKEVAALSTRRQDLRHILRPLINWYPCRAFRRVFRRAACQGAHGAFRAWFEMFPDIKEDIKPGVMKRARHSIDACLLWARYFDGGDLAWRRIAQLIKKHDDRRARDSTYDAGDFLRHDLDTHGTVTRWEAAQINRFLIELEYTTLRSAGNSYWWQLPAPDVYAEVDHRSAFRCAFLSSWFFAREHWNSADIALYSGVVEMITKELGWSQTDLDAFSELVLRDLPSEDNTPDLRENLHNILGLPP